MTARRGLILSVFLSFAILASLSWQACAENVLILKNEFIQKYKNRATIEANYVIDKAHKKPNVPSKDADIHIAGRAPDDIGLATVAEIMNAAERPEAVDAVHAAEGTGQPIKVVGVWRIWAEHGGDTQHTQGKALAAFDTTNPDHVFEIHPVTELAGIDVKPSLHPIDGYEPKETEQAFTVYERTRSKITPMNGGKVKIETPMAGMNYVKFQMELNEKALTIHDGRIALAKVLNGEGELVARNRRMVFVKDTPPELAVRGKSAGDCLVVLGIPRINLTLVDWRVKHSKAKLSSKLALLPFSLCSWPGTSRASHPLASCTLNATATALKSTLDKTASSRHPFSISFPADADS